MGWWWSSVHVVIGNWLEVEVWAIAWTLGKSQCAPSPTVHSSQTPSVGWIGWQVYSVKRTCSLQLLKGGEKWSFSFYFVFGFLRHGLTIKPRWASNLPPSHVSLLSAGMQVSTPCLTSNQLYFRYMTYLKYESKLGVPHSLLSVTPPVHTLILVLISLKT